MKDVVESWLDGTRSHFPTMINIYSNTINEDNTMSTIAMNTVAAAYRVVVLFESITLLNDSNISIGEHHYDVLTDGQRIALVRVEDRETMAEYQLIDSSWVEVIEPGMVARQAIEVLNDINAKYSEWESSLGYYGTLVEDYEDMDQLLSLPPHHVEVDDIPF